MEKTQETIERDARIVEMFRAGKSIKEIALAVGRRKTTVAQVIKDFLREEADEDEDAPLPPRPKGFGAVKAPRLKIPPLEQGKLYSLPEFATKTAEEDGARQRGSCSSSGLCLVQECGMRCSCIR